MTSGYVGQGGLRFFHPVPELPARSQAQDFASHEVPAASHLAFTDLDQAGRSQTRMHAAGPVGPGLPTCYLAGGTPGVWVPGGVAAHSACSPQPQERGTLGKRPLPLPLLRGARYLSLPARGAAWASASHLMGSPVCLLMGPRGRCRLLRVWEYEWREPTLPSPWGP